MPSDLYQTPKKEPEVHRALLSYADEEYQEELRQKEGEQQAPTPRQGQPLHGRGELHVPVVHLETRSIFWAVFNGVFSALVAFTILLALTCAPELADDLRPPRGE